MRQSMKALSVTQRTGATALLVSCGLLLMDAAPIAARSRAAVVDGVLLPNGTNLPIGGAVDPDYVSLWINGLLEYGFTPLVAMSPVPSAEYPRPAELVADWFLRNNRAALGILQDVSEFERTAIDVLCDGTEVVTFAQHYNFTPVETSFVRLTITEQIVRRVEARFIAEPWQLPVCQAAPPNGRPPLDPRYFPTGTSTVVVVTTIDQLTHGQQGQIETVWNACTNQVLGTTTRVVR